MFLWEGIINEQYFTDKIRFSRRNLAAESRLTIVLSMYVSLFYTFQFSRVWYRAR